MAVGKQNPRLPRDFYHMVRPNTALWIGRILPLMPWVGVVFLGLEFWSMGWNIPVENIGAYHVFMFAVAVGGLFISLYLDAGVWQQTKTEHLDEFQKLRIERARLFSYRSLVLLVVGIFLIWPTAWIFFGDFGLGFPDPKQGETMYIAGNIVVYVAITFAPAYYHWTLKPVPAEENVRPDPPFKTVVHLKESE